MNEIEHYLELAEHAARAAESANDLDSFRHFREEAVRCLRAAKLEAGAAAIAPRPERDAERIPSLYLAA